MPSDSPNLVGVSSLDIEGVSIAAKGSQTDPMLRRKRLFHIPLTRPDRFVATGVAASSQTVVDGYSAPCTTCVEVEVENKEMRWTSGEANRIAPRASPSSQARNPSNDVAGGFALWMSFDGVECLKESTTSDHVGGRLYSRT